MKDKYKIIRKNFEKIISEKNIEKQKRNKSFIISHNKYIEENIESNRSALNYTKNSCLNEENKKDILNKKFNILKKTLEKLQFIIEKNIKSESDCTFFMMDNIKKVKNFYINEFINNKKSFDRNLNIKRENILNKIENNEQNKLSSDIKIMLDNNLNNMNQQLNKLNIYTNKQNNYFNNINEDINEQMIIIYNTIKQNEINDGQKIEKIKNKIKYFGDKENIKREKFREDIFSILNIELNKLIK